MITKLEGIAAKARNEMNFQCSQRKATGNLMNIESDKTIRYSSETYIRRNKSNGCAVKQRPNSVVREICTLRCVGVGAILMMVPFYPACALEVHSRQ